MIDKKKEELPMAVSAILQKEQICFVKEMDEYIEKLKKKPNELSEKEAVEALKRTGVITRNGKLKKTIVSWE